jgi:hypothetical protein
VTTSTTPTPGGPLHSGGSASADVDRWLPDPSWPVPPRGWHLWAAAGSPARTDHRSDHHREGDTDQDADQHTRGDGSGIDVAPAIDHTVPVTPQMSEFAVPEEPSFTLPARPGLLVAAPVDLLADPDSRRLPEGAASGFAVLGALVLFSCLVGGLTGGLVVLGVSTLLTAVAALVHGRVSLTSVGGQRGASLLLGAAVTALILGSVVTQERRAAPEAAAGVPVPVSSPFAVETQTAYAVVPDPAATATPTPAAKRPATVPGLSISSDALTPRPTDDTAQKATAKAAEKAQKATDKAAGKAQKATDKAAGKAQKATDKAAGKTQKTASKATEKASRSGKPATSGR